MTQQNQYFPQSLPHPGDTLAEKLDEMGLSSVEFAMLTGKTETIINAVLNGKRAITPDMAAKFETVTKIPAHFWLNSQLYYDDFMARKNYKRVVKADMHLQPA